MGVWQCSRGQVQHWNHCDSADDVRSGCAARVDEIQHHAVVVDCVVGLEFWRVAFGEGKGICRFI